MPDYSKIIIYKLINYDCPELVTLVQLLILQKGNRTINQVV